MHPLVCLLIPSTTGRNDMQMRIVLAITSMRLDHDDIAALEGLTAHCTKEIVQAFHPTLHERTEQRFGMLIKWCSQDIRHGELHKAVALLEEQGLESPCIDDISHA